MSRAATIAELKELTEQVCESVDRTFAMVSFSPDMQAAFAIEGGMRVYTANAAWHKVLGYSTKNVEGKPYRTFIHPDDLLELDAKVEQVRQTGDAMGLFRSRMRHSNGSYILIEWNVSAPVDGRCYAVGRKLTNG